MAVSTGEMLARSTLLGILFGKGGDINLFCGSGEWRRKS